MRTGLSKDGKVYTRFIHQLVALTYIPNPEGKATVNHKDEVKTNNRVENLEWMTNRENLRYGTRDERVSLSLQKPVKCIETGEVFESINIAAKAINRDQSSLSKCLRGKTKTCAKLHWKYYEEVAEE